MQVQLIYFLHLHYYNFRFALEFSNNMGSAASVNLTSEQKVSLTNHLSNFYELHKDNHNELPALLESEYNRLTSIYIDDISKHPDKTISNPHSSVKFNGNTASTKSIKSPPPNLKLNLATKSIDNNEKSTKEGSNTHRGPSLSARLNARGAGQGTTNNRGARRRSFDNKASPDKKPEPTLLSEVSSSTSLPNIQLEEVVDNWDSVTQQPYCDICKMVFKNVPFLERHIKYSSVHSDNLKLVSGECKEISSPGPSLSQFAKKYKESISQINIAPQEEGTHYRLLYSGSKFFWRCKQNIEFEIFDHFLPLTVEIVPYHVEKQFELPRIYLSYPKMLKSIQPAVEAETSAKIKDMLKDRFSKPDKEVIFAELQLQKVVTYMLMRLNFVPQSEIVDQDHCEFVTLTGDDLDEFPLISNPPKVLVPINLSRRRRSTVEEISNTLKSISTDQQAISEDLKRANYISIASRITDIIFNAASYLTDKKWYDDLPKYRRLWAKAINKVIHRNQVIKNREYLENNNFLLFPNSPTVKKMVRASYPQL